LTIDVRWNDLSGMIPLTPYDARNSHGRHRCATSIPWMMPLSATTRVMTMNSTSSDTTVTTAPSSVAPAAIIQPIITAVHATIVQNAAG
jgi:hypothetical protein